MHLKFQGTQGMGDLKPLKLVITNYPEDQVEEVQAVNNPEKPEAGTRSIPFSREVYIERDDFMEDPPKKYFRLGPGREVRLKYAYIVECVDFKKDPVTGEITEIHCIYDPDTKSGGPNSSKKVKGTLSWVSVAQSLPAKVHLYDRLFDDEDPGGHKDKDFKEFLNPDSLKVLTHSRVEPSLKNANSLDHFQFERQGYFSVDSGVTPRIRNQEAASYD